MLKTSVEDIMTEDIVTLGKDATVMDAAHILLRFQINGLLVVDKKDSRNLVGILTTTDLLRLLNAALTSHHAHRMHELERVGRLQLKEVVSSEVTGVQKGTKLAKVIGIMHRKNRHTLPVFDGKKLVGVVGRHDILNAAFYS